MPEAFPHLKHAPITEALLDLRVQLPGAFGESALEEFRGRVRASFPEERPIKRVQAQLAFGDGGAGLTTAAPEAIGSIFWSSSQKRAVQARIDGFSVDHVGDYEDWGALTADARRYWQDFVAAAHPQKVTRCAARFINRIEIPAGDDLKTHMQTRPEIGDKLPQLMDEYFLRVVVPFKEGRRAVITQTSIPAEDGAASTSRSILLDIDAFTEIDLAPDSPELWAEVEALRAVKNSCFFNSLQPETWRTYQ